MPGPIVTKNEEGEEIVTLPKADFDKIQSDRDNYRDLGLKAKKEEDDRKAKDEQDKKDREATAAAAANPDTKVTELATGAARKVQREASERTARRAILAKYPEYADQTQLAGMLANLNIKDDDVTAEDIIDRFETAILVHKKETGKLEEHMATMQEHARNQGRSEAAMGMGMNAGGAGGGNGGGTHKGKLTPEGEQLTKSFHNDPEKVGKVDPKVDNVIEIKRK